MSNFKDFSKKIKKKCPILINNFLYIFVAIERKAGH